MDEIYEQLRVLGRESSGKFPQVYVPCSGTSEHDEHARNDGR